MAKYFGVGRVRPKYIVGSEPRHTLQSLALSTYTPCTTHFYLTTDLYLTTRYECLADDALKAWLLLPLFTNRNYAVLDVPLFSRR
jgi:hypothetical protein